MLYSMGVVELHCTALQFLFTFVYPFDLPQQSHSHHLSSLRLATIATIYRPSRALHQVQLTL
jgi:hypothetical protein